MVVAMASSLSTLAISLSLLLLLICSAAQTEYESHRRLGAKNQCRLDQIRAEQPTRRVESQAGFTEHYAENNEGFQCSGVTLQRRVIYPRGLLLPSFFNAPRLVYILQGCSDDKLFSLKCRGIFGTVVPGCLESFQQFQPPSQPWREERRGTRSMRDQHQRINRFKEGDLLALPAGFAHWAYNDGEQPVVAITVIDTSNSASQLDPSRRQFLLAGRKQRGQRFSFEPAHEEDSADNILNGFDTETLAEVLGISRDLAEKLKGQNDNRGEIVKVEEEFQVIRPSKIGHSEEYGYEEERRRTPNGLEQAFCSMRITENMDNPARADIYNPNAGRITTINSQKLPILRFLQLSAEKGVVHRNALISPHWNVNAHAIVYVSRGQARFEIVGQRGNTVHNDEVRQGQVVVVPQHFVTLIRAGSDGFEYVAFFTNDNAIVSNIVGKDSVFKGLPEEVIMNAYRISREEAGRLKNNRGQQIALFEPSSQHRRYG